MSRSRRPGASSQKRRATALAGVLILLGASCYLALTGTAGADLTSGQQIKAAVPQAPFSAGLPFASGQQITVSVPANTILPHNQNIHIVMCDAGPGGAPPTGVFQCDNNTQYANTVVVNSDGSFSVSDFNVYALPSLALGETASNGTQCGSAAQECILYIGPDQSQSSLPHVWSQGFSVVKTDAAETGTVSPGDGTAASAASAPDPGLSTVTASPATAVANGVDASTVTATMLGKNGQGNTSPVPAGTAVTLTPVSGTSQVSAISGTTDANGVATFKVTDTTPEAVQYKASALGVTVTAQPSVTFQPQTVSAATSKVVASPAAVAADGSTASTVTVTLYDQGLTSAPIAGQPVTLAQDSGKHSVIHAVSATTNSSGVATFTVTDTTPELVTYTAQAGGVTVVTSAKVTFGSLSASATDSTVTASQSTADTGSGGGTTVTVTLKTVGGGSPVAGKVVSLAPSPSTTATATAVTPGATSDANGQVVFQVTDSAAEPVTFTATDTTDTVTVTQTATVTFKVSTGPSVSASLSSVVISPSTVTADGTTPSTFFVTIRDSSNQTVPGEVISVAPTVSDAKVTVTPIIPAGANEVAGETDSTGQATFQIRGTQASSVAFTVVDTTDSNLVIAPSVTHTVTFVPGPVDGTQSGITASPSAVNADGTASTVTVTLNDHFGNPVAGKTVALDQGTGHASITALSAVTDPTGVATFKVSDTTPEYVRLAAIDVDDGNLLISSTVQVTFGTPPPILPDPNDSAIVVDSSSVPADGKTAASVSVLLYDVNGQPVSGRNVSLKASGGSSQITAVKGTTDASGQATFSVTDTKVESVSYTATDTSDAVAVSGSVTVSFTTAAPASSAAAARSIIGMTATSDNGGYSLGGSDGSISAFGDAAAHGGLGGSHLNQPIVGMAATPDGGGYWLVASDGGIFTFGDAAFHGSTGGDAPQPAHRGHGRHPRRRRLLAGGLGRRHLHLRRRRLPRLDRRRCTSTSPSWAWPPPPTAVATGWWPRTAASSPSATPASTARPAAMHLNQPIVGMAATPDGGGYWLVASDGGIFTFGDAVFHGSTGGDAPQPAHCRAWPPPPTGGGYWLVASDGGVFNLGDASFHGSAA